MKLTIHYDKNNIMAMILTVLIEVLLFKPFFGRRITMYDWELYNFIIFILTENGHTMFSRH